MQLFIKQTNNADKQLNYWVSCLFLILLLSGSTGCKDKDKCISCPDDMICSPTKEYCQCDDGQYRVYDFSKERWTCTSMRDHIVEDSTIEYNYLFNGNQFGIYGDDISAYNNIYKLSLLFNKIDRTYTKYWIENRSVLPYNRIYSKVDSLSGDSIFLHHMGFTTSTPPVYEYNGERVLPTGYGRISPDKDTIDMAVYFIPLRLIDDYEQVPVDISKAIDVRKMTLLSSRVLPKF